MVSGMHGKSPSFSVAKSSVVNSTFYDGKQFISRLGNPFTPPQWFLDSSLSDFKHRFSTDVSAPELPKDVTLDGELYGGRGEFQSTVSIVKTVNSIHWKNITFQVRIPFRQSSSYQDDAWQLFDIPSRGDEPFEERYSFLQKTFGEGGTHAAEQIQVVHQEIVKDRQHVLDKLKEIENLGGEGLMLRKAKSFVSL
jgi:DNA ligase-1